MMTQKSTKPWLEIPPNTALSTAAKAPSKDAGSGPGQQAVIQFA
jgi:hypothetical protein